MPGTICKPVRAAAADVGRVARRPLGLVASRYERWRAERRELRAREEEARRLKAETASDLRELHDLVWGRWADAATKYTLTAKEETNGESE